MTPDQMRYELSQVYSGPKWKKKVADMTDAQVIAIYKSMVREGRLFKHPSVAR